MSGTVFFKRNHESLSGCRIDLFVGCSYNFFQREKRIEKNKQTRIEQKTTQQAWEEYVLLPEIFVLLLHMYRVVLDHGKGILLAVG